MQRQLPRPATTSQRIEQSGLDLTHHIHDGEADVIVTGAKQLAALKTLGLRYRRRDRRPQRALRAQPRGRRALRRARSRARRCPSGRDDYRVLAGLPGRAQEARRRAPRPRQAGRPAQEDLPGPRDHGRRDRQGRRRATTAGPSTSSTACTTRASGRRPRAAMEFAHLLAKGHGKDARITSLLDRERVVIVPMINVDGFVESREGAARRRPRPGRRDRHRRPADRRGRRAARRLVRLPAQELRRRDPERRRAVHAAVRRRPEPQLRRRLGRPGRGHRPDHPELPRHRARSPSPRPRRSASTRSSAPGHEPDHDAQRRRARAAPAGHRQRRQGARRGRA